MPAQRALLPRSAPTAALVSSGAIAALLDRLEERAGECHSIMVVRGGHVVAEGWWAPFSADRPHLLYSLTKSFTSTAAGLAIADGLLSLDDRVVDVLPDRVPAGAGAQARRITVHHLLSMTAGHDTDSLSEAWRTDPRDLVKGFLRMPFTEPEGTRHTYDNATTYVLARMVERVTGRGLPEFLDERLFAPMGVGDADWDRVAGGSSFGFHGLHLTTEAVAAFGELLLRGGRWGDRQLVPREWVELATRRHVATLPPGDADFCCGYGYQFWMARNGFHANGSFGQMCVVVPSHDLVVAVTGANSQAQVIHDAIRECLLPGIDQTDDGGSDDVLADRLRRLSLVPPHGLDHPHRSVKAIVESPVLPEGTPVTVDPVEGGWSLRLGSQMEIAAGHGEWRESHPLGRPVVAAGAWQDDVFVADLYVITTPHRVRLSVDARTRTATAVWNLEPLTTPDLQLHLRSPLMTRPDVA
jgi:CubicO group peptidase (beta-lactamase class C family)